MGWKWDKKDDNIKDFFSGMKPHTSRFIKDLVPWRWVKLTHSYVNLWVEAGRLSPYHSGHIAAFLFLAMTFLFLALMIGVILL